MTTEEWKDIPLCELATVIGGEHPVDGSQSTGMETCPGQRRPT